MTEPPSRFWNVRYKTIGHTGWRDPSFYAYDQLERLALISEKISQLDKVPKTSFDFGCGTGDFSKLMLEKGIRVWGYDPYVKPEIYHPDFTYINQHIDLDKLRNKIDLIISVTVLDHILNDLDFVRELAYLRTMISDHGHLLMLEYALDDPVRSPNVYQAFRTLDQWHEELFNSRWKITSIKSVPHPLLSPSIGFEHYKSRTLVYLINKLARYNLLNPLLLPLLKKIAYSTFFRYGLGQVVQSPLKLISCQPN
jgi:SAM-dependent methyltransferase